MKLYHAKYAQPLPGGTVTIREEDFYLPDVISVRRQLRGRGLWPIKILEQKPPAFEWLDVRSREWQKQLLRALRFQTATASAGTALLNIIEGEADARRRMVFLPARTVLKGGGSFSDALKSLKLMDAATMAIIVSGERAGDLKGVIQHAMQHVEEKGKQTKVVLAALSWMAFDISNVISALWGAQFGFIPYLRANAPTNTTPEQMQKLETAITRASWINGSLIVITTAVIGGAIVLAAAFWMNRHKADHLAARLVMRVPLFGEYLRNSALFDTCRLIARLLNGKVPLDEALKIIIETTIEPSARSYWRECRSRIMKGIEPSKALARWPLTKGERDQIATVQSVDQLTEVYEAIAAERQLMAKATQRRIVVSGVACMMTLFGAVVLTMIYLLMIQNSGFMDSLQGMREG
ncbi:MAG: type II secretion system F family protein [Alphaproteobacteria bacterium]